MSTIDVVASKTSLTPYDISKEISKSSSEFLKNVNNNKEEDKSDLGSSILDNYSITLETHSKIMEPRTTRIPQAITTQPTEFEKKKQGSAFVKKVRARINEKIVFLEKAIDTYGIIDDIIYDGGNSIISARIYDLHDHTFIDEISFDSKEFSKSDRTKLMENAIFYWFVGVEKNIFGNEHRVSEFRLRRIFTEK